MLYHLTEFLKEYDFPGAGLMSYITFRSGMALILSLFISMVIGKRIIERLQLMQIGEIVRDLSSRIAKMPQAQPSTKAPARTVTTTIGPHREYTVVAGDTLSIIASAFNTTVAKIKEMNGLKSDALRIGQKVKVPLKD